MAGIDKTYLNWEDYCTLREWCKDKSFTVGNRKIKVSNFLYTHWDKEDFDICKRPIWNTPTYLDVWLIRNCPLPFITERLKEQYSETMYNEIVEYKSQYDTFKRNGLGKNIKYKVLKYPEIRWVSYRAWWIQCDNIRWDYNEKDDMWYHYCELMPKDTNTATMKNFSLKKFHRKLKKWNLPAGLTFRVTGQYVGQEYLIKTV